MVISSGKSIPSLHLPSHTLKLNLNTITECVGIEIERLQTRQVYLITPHSQSTPSNTTFVLFRNDSNPNEAFRRRGKSNSLPLTHKSTLESQSLIHDERGAAERDHFQFGQVYSITHAHKSHSQTQHSCYHGTIQIQMKDSVAGANLTHHHSFTSPLLKMTFSLWMNVELPNAIVSSLR